MAQEPASAASSGRVGSCAALSRTRADQSRRTSPKRIPVGRPAATGSGPRNGQPWSRCSSRIRPTRSLRPTWAPDGHRLLYSRFVPSPLGRRPGSASRQVRGDRPGLSRSKTNDPERPRGRACPSTSAPRSSSSSRLEPRRPVRGGAPARSRRRRCMIVLPESGRLIKTLEGASHPSWSPDGTRLAFVRQVEETRAKPDAPDPGAGLRHRPRAGRARRADRIARLEPGWPVDPGRPVDGPSRGREIELVRVIIDSGLSSRLLPLTFQFQPGNRPGRPCPTSRDLDDGTGLSARRSFIGFDREQEFCASRPMWRTRCP